MTDIAQQQDLLYQRLTQAVQTNPGSTPPLLRKTLIEYATQAKSEPESALPSDLQAYVTKVRKYAYKVMDEDIEQLRSVGYSEEAIFEITVSTALGAGSRCLMRGMAALEGVSDALTDH